LLHELIWSLEKLDLHGRTPRSLSVDAYLMLVLKIAAGIIVAFLLIAIAQVCFAVALIGGIANTPARPPVATFGGAGAGLPTPARTASASPRPTAPSASPSPTAAPAPLASPATTASTSPSPTTAPVVVTFTLVKSPVARGSTGQVNVTSAPNLSCSITVSYASGPSTAQGLTPKTTDGAGAVSWTWTVGANATPGTWPIDVRCGSAIGHASFVVQ
jgi:hypothetical protein